MSADASHQKTATRGRLRIYLGYAPGAGATCALLREGRQRAGRGADVVVARVQTHGRPHTQALLAGLDIIPGTTVRNLGAAAEINLGAVLARRPDVTLVDELADRSLLRTGHAPRWQDVQALLAAGIDVISTVSISHLASLADVVEKITGVAPAQMVPDLVVRAAAEIELVDAMPEDLRQRMTAGHIYPPPQAAAVLGGWFCSPNLSVLRELALRWLAATLTGGPRRYRPAACVPGHVHAREKVVVAVGGGPESERLIRRAARIAARSGGDLLAVHATRPGRPAAGRAAITAQQQLTRALGGSYHQLADDDVPAALLAFAHAENATQLVLGATRNSRPSALLPWRGTTPQVLRRAGGLDVHIVTCTPTANGVPPAASEPDQKRRTAMTEQNASWPGRVRSAAHWGRRRPASGVRRHPQRMGWLASAAMVAVSLIVAACAGSSSSAGGAAPSPPSAATGAASSGSALRTATINGIAVLTNAKGFTLYSFAPDTPTTSRCNGQCATFWPPVKGPVTAGPGATGSLGTIMRSDGATQATYNGHPLYTYIADTAPGQAKGNGLNASGGVWHEVTASGAAAPSPSSGGGGYGY